MSGEPVASTDLPVMGRAPSPTEPAVTRTSPQPSLESASVAQEQVSASGQRRLRASGRVGFDGLFPAVVGGLSLVVAAGLAWSSRRRVAAE